MKAFYHCNIFYIKIFCAHEYYLPFYDLELSWSPQNQYLNALISLVTLVENANLQMLCFFYVSSALKCNVIFRII